MANELAGKSVALLVATEEVHVDRSGGATLVSSRKPDDLKAFCATLVEELAR